MRLEVLLATTNQSDYTLIDKINLQSDIIVCNQNSFETKFEEFEVNGNKVKWYSFIEQGVGLNRNNALMRSDADICLIADDDVFYEKNYKQIVIEAFENNPKADVILFNVYPNENYHPYVTTKKKVITRLNCGKFGGVRIAFRRSKVIKNTITFNLLFGGGAIFSAGEDIMFIRDCIRKGLKVIAVPNYILSLKNERESTWFTGYNDKFFQDVGSSFEYHFGKFAFLMSIIQLVRKRNLWLKEYSFFDALRKVREGIQIYKNL